MRKWLRLTALALCLCLLCSCNAVSLSGTESLLVAPTFNKRQDAVSKALGTTMPLNNIIYKYPQYGEYRSPFVFYDLDGDGKEEAVVFYASTNDPNGYVRFKILTEDPDGKWSPFHDYPSDSSQIEFVQFRHLLDKEASCMIIGWKGQGRQASTLAVYSMQNGACRQQASAKYISYSIDDFDRDGLSEVILVNQEASQRRFSVSLWRGRDGLVETAGQILLAEDTEAVLGLIFGRLWDGSGAVYIDEALAGGPSLTIATEVIRVTRSGLSLLAGGEAPGPDEPENPAHNNYTDTFRDEEVLCMDVDGDGIVEVPGFVSLPGTDTDLDTIKLTHFMHLAPEGFIIWNSGVMNTQAGYLIYFPDRWIGQVVVERGQETSEWHFRKWNNDLQEPAEELLRVRVYSIKEYRDMFEDYVELAAKGATSYSAYIPKIPGEALAVSEYEVKEMFRLLPS